MGTFSEAARLAGIKARKRNNLLRKKGLLPPIKSRRSKSEGESIPLDSPVFSKPLKGDATKRVVRKLSGNTELLALFLRIVEKLL